MRFDPKSLGSFKRAGLPFVVAWGIIVAAAGSAFAEIPIEKVQRFKQACDAEQKKQLREAEAELGRLRQQTIQGFNVRGQLNAAKAYVNRIKKGPVYPILESKKVGGIGMVLCPHREGFPVIEENDYLTLDTTFEALGGSRDNGQTFRGVTITGYGRFILKGYDPKRLTSTHYSTPKQPDVYEVTGEQSGLPVLEPFDADAAMKVLAGRPRPLPPNPGAVIRNRKQP